jgi:hypothetical protein
MEPHHNAQTNLGEALKFLNNIMKKRTIAFLLSDFISASYQDALQVAAKRHDIIGMHVFDKRDKELPDIGIVKVIDAESGLEKWIDTSSEKFRKLYTYQFQQRETETKNIFLKSGAAFVPLQTDDDYIKKLQQFFKTRK